MNKITAVELWEARKDCIILDVRSPGEFLQGHIPRASNLPIFSDEERARVGTLYKQTSREVAFLEGLDLLPICIPSTSCICSSTLNALKPDTMLD